MSKMGRQAKLVNEYVMYLCMCVCVCVVYMEAMFSL